MFSGIVEGIGVVLGVQAGGAGRRLSIDAGPLAAELEPGDSVSVDGACLTVETVAEDHFSVAAVPATLSRTIAGGYEEGTRVNLERALRVDGRLDGHLVQGHVDGIGSVSSSIEEGESRTLRFRIPDAVAAVTVEHGSIAINGVSLTVSRLLGSGEIEVAVIPFTLAHTNLRFLGHGDRVNVEGDLIGKYVGRMLAPYREEPT